MLPLKTGVNISKLGVFAGLQAANQVAHTCGRLKSFSKHMDNLLFFDRYIYDKCKFEIEREGEKERTQAHPPLQAHPPYGKEVGN